MRGGISVLPKNGKSEKGIVLKPRTYRIGFGVAVRVEVLLLAKAKYCVRERDSFHYDVVELFTQLGIMSTHSLMTLLNSSGLHSW